MKVLGTLVGKCEDETSAERISNLFEKCPYNISNKAENKFITLLFYIPEDHAWWIKEIKQDPEGTLGLKKADVFFSDEFDSLIDVEYEKDLEEAPCGTDCGNCEFYPDECTGCPSTVYHMAQ